MDDTSPENDDWLRSLVKRSPLLDDPAIRRHWNVLVPWLATADRYALAAILLEVEHTCEGAE
jgi:hypothetical protein